MRDQTTKRLPTLVEGLRESIAIAIHLNRTLVLPPMYRHFTDPDGPNGVVDRLVIFFYLNSIDTYCIEYAPSMLHVTDCLSSFESLGN